MNAVQKACQQNSLTGMKAKDVSEVLGAYKDQMAQMLPKFLTAERMIAMAATEVTRNPKLLACTPSSLVGAVLQASILGFQPVASLGYCYFVPYGKDVQFQIGYKGYIALARRSGNVRNIYAEVVHQGDDFEYTLGLHRDLVHKPTGDISTPITHVYAVAELADDSTAFVVLSRAEVERLRLRSPMQKAQPSGAWATDYEAMAKAKALKQLSKYLPVSVDEVNALASDEAVIPAKAFNAKTGEVEVEQYAYESTAIDTDGEEVADVIDAENNAKGEDVTSDIFEK